MNIFKKSVFTYTVLHGEYRLIIKEELELGWFFVIGSFQAFPKVTKMRKPIFGNELRNYYVTWLFYVKTNITNEIPVV